MLIPEESRQGKTCWMGSGNPCVFERHLSLRAREDEFKELVWAYLRKPHLHMGCRVCSAWVADTEVNHSTHALTQSSTSAGQKHLAEDTSSDAAPPSTRPRTGSLPREARSDLDALLCWWSSKILLDISLETAMREIASGACSVTAAS